MSKRLTLKQFSTSQQTYDAIITLNKEFTRVNRKNSAVELYYSERGNRFKPVYEVTAYYEDANINELEWFKNQIEML